MESSDREVIVTDIRMPFWSMVTFMVKWVIASIPAFAILAALWTLFMLLSAGVLRGLGAL